MQLPEKYHKDDKQWIEEQLTQINLISHPLMSNKVAKQYSDAFAAAFEAGQPEHTKSNKARCEANTRLRLYVKSLQAKTVAPPTR